MEQDFSIQEEVSEYVSYDKLNNLFVNSTESLSKLMSNISVIPQLEGNQNEKQNIRSQLKQLSNQSIVFNKTLMELTLSFNEENEEHENEKFEKEEQKEDDENKQMDNSNIYMLNNKSIQSDKINLKDQQKVSKYNNQQNNNSLSRLVNQNENEKNTFYKCLNNVQFSRELNYFYQQNGENNNDASEKIIIKQENIQMEDSDTLNQTNYSIINDEIFQKRQSEKKFENNKQQMKQMCSSFIEDKEQVSDIITKQEKIEGSKTINYNEGKNNLEESLIRDEIQQQNQNKINENEQQNQIQVQNIERELDDQIRDNNQNSNIQIGGKNKLINLQLIVLLFVFILLIANITISVLDKQGNIFKFVSYKFKKYFIDKEDTQLSQVLQNNIKLQQQVDIYVNELKYIKDLNKKQSEELQKNITDLLQNLQNQKQIINQMQEEKQQQSHQQEDLIQQIKQLRKEVEKCQETEELYNNLQQVLELYKTSTQ